MVTVQRMKHAKNVTFTVKKEVRTQFYFVGLGRTCKAKAYCSSHVNYNTQSSAVISIIYYDLKYITEAAWNSSRPQNNNRKPYE